MKTRLCFIDDDDDCRRQWLEWAKKNNYTAKAFDDVFAANKYRADVYIFDISAVCYFMLDLSRAYAPIARLMQDHPGAEIVIGSAVSRNTVEDVLDSIEQETGRRPRFFDVSQGFSGLEKVMSVINPTNKMPPRI